MADYPYEIEWPEGFTPPEWIPPTEAEVYAGPYGQLIRDALQAVAGAGGVGPPSRPGEDAYSRAWGVATKAEHEAARQRWLQGTQASYGVWSDVQRTARERAAAKKQQEYWEAAEAARLQALAEEKARRLAALRADPRMWIQYAEQTEAPTPTTPGWLQRILMGRGAGQAIPRGGTPSFFSEQLWGQMSSSEQQALLGYLDWLGVPAEDWLGRMSGLWREGVHRGPVSWRPAGAR